MSSIDPSRQEDPSAGHPRTVSSLLGPSMTPRMLLLARIAGQPPPLYDPDEPLSIVQLSLRNLITTGGLDVSLTNFQRLVLDDLDRNIGAALLDPIIYRSVGVMQCRMCTRVKFKALPFGPYKHPHPWAMSIHEFPLVMVGLYRRLTKCEKSQSICAECLLAHIMTSLSRDFFWNLDRGSESGWIPCPVPGCDEFVDSPPFALYRCLEQLGCRDRGVVLAQYARATLLRKALLDIHRDPSNSVVFSEEGLFEAAALHNHLQRHNIMKSFFDPCFDTRDDQGNAVDFAPGRIIISTLQRKDGDLTVPIFMKFFNRKRPENGRVCQCCYNVVCEIDYGDVEKWYDILSPKRVDHEGFLGPWMWKVLGFPNFLTIAGCTHPMDQCTECVDKYIIYALARLGPNAPPSVKCPGFWGCHRTMRDDEIRLYADDETLVRFEKLVRRWEMRSDFLYRECPSCDHGQIYKFDGDYNLKRMIKCVKCGYKMCFHHKSPWHEGLTCSAFDRKMEVEFEFKNSQRWIQESTKACPRDGCGAPIEKIDGCSHMTCENCDFAFCWDCLGEFRPEADGNGNTNGKCSCPKPGYNEPA